MYNNRYHFLSPKRKVREIERGEGGREGERAYLQVRELAKIMRENQRQLNEHDTENS